MEELKRCSSCKKLRPVQAFTRSNESKDGLKSQCRDCRNHSASQARKAQRDRNAAAGSASEREREARARALRALVENHRGEFAKLLANYRMQLEVPSTPAWIAVTS